MDRCSQPECDDYNGTRQPPNNPSIWFEQDTDHHGTPVHGSLSNGSEFDDIWYTTTEPASFSSQSTGVASGTWSGFGNSSMHFNEKLFQYSAGDPQTIYSDTELSWLPTESTHMFDTANQHHNTAGSGGEVPWSSDARTNLLENNDASNDARDVAIEHASSSCGRSSDSDDSDAAIGIALKNGRFKCNMGKCRTRTFKRPAELRRHYYTTHAARKPEFWCEVLRCDRSAEADGRPFHRRYRLLDHMRKIHGSVGSTGDCG